MILTAWTFYLKWHLRDKEGRNYPSVINTSMHQQDVIYTHNKILFSLENKGNSDMYFNIDEPHKYYAK